MADDANPWWIVLISAGIPTIGLLFKERIGLLTARDSGKVEQAKLAQAERANVLSSMDNRQAAYMDRLEGRIEAQDATITRLNTRIEEVEGERDEKDAELDSWRRWGREQEHDVQSARMAAEAFAKRLNLPDLIWKPSITAPNTVEPPAAE